MNTKTVFTIFLVASMFMQNVNAKVTSNPAYNAKELLDIGVFPSWFQDAMAREKKVKKKSRLKLKEFNVNKKIAGKVELIDQADGDWLYYIDIGTDSPVECYIFSEFDGPANSLYAMLDNALTVGVAEANQKPLTSQHNFAIGSGVIGATPYLLLDTLYTLGEGQDKVSGVLKGLSAETSQSLQVCMHNEVGYQETFFSVFESFIQAITENEESPEFFDTVVQMSLNDIPVGFSRESFIVDADGDVQIKLESSTLVPVDASMVSRSDSESNSWSDPDGGIINENVYSIENSTLASNLSLNWQEEKWHVTGVIQGKEVGYELSHTDWLLSNYGSYLAVMDLNKSDENSAEYSMWLPDTDPSEVATFAIKKLANNPDANYEMSMGPLEMQVLADDSGVFQNATLEQGPVKMKLKKVFVKGKPSL